MRASLVLALLLFSMALAPCDAAPAIGKVGEDDACKSVKKQVAKIDGASDRYAVGAGWSCDITIYSERWFLIGLRSDRKCDGICSNLRGWFAVDRMTGSVHDFDMGEYQVGAPLLAK